MFDIGIGLKQARADLKQFVTDTQKELSSLTFNPREKANASRAGNGLHRDFAIEQANADRLAQIRSDALQRLDQIDATYGSQQLARRQQLERVISSITTQGANRRISEVTREVNANLKQFERQARAQQNSHVSASGNGKGIAAVFQVQQAIEDFSYAGLRGSANNAAMLASQLGGPAGLIALLGISATQAYGMASAFNQPVETRTRHRSMVGIEE